MAKIKLQVYRGEEPGQTVGPADVDFRGENWHGAGTPEPDRHRTIIEFKTEDKTIIDDAVALGPQINTLFERLTGTAPKFADGIASALGLEGEGMPHLGIRVYDDED